MSDDRLERLVRANAGRAWRMAMGLCGREADADDLVQQALLVAARKRKSIPAGEAWPWLARILILEFRNARRGSRLAPIGDDAVLTPDERTRDPQSLAEDAELVEALKLELSRLSAEEREAVVLTHVTGLSFREAAIATDLPLATFSDRVARTMDRLRRRVRLGEGSLAGLLAVMPLAPPPGGLEAATMSWLATVEGAAGAAIAATSVGGLVVAKKIAFAFLVVVVCVFGYLGADALSSEEGPEFTGTPSAVDEEKAAGVEPSRATVDDERVGEIPDDPEALLVAFGRVAGRVLDESGRAVAARVRIVRDPGPDFIDREKLLDESALTDETGRFEMTVRRPPQELERRYTFRVEATAAGSVGASTVPLFLEHGGVLEGVELTVFEPHQVSGRVVDRTTGEPLAGLRVVPHVGAPERGGRLESYVLDEFAISDADGRFVLDDLPAASVSLDVVFPDGAGGWISPLCEPEAEVTVPRDGDVEPIDIRVSSNVLRFTIAAGGPETVVVGNDYETVESMILLGRATSVSAVGEVCMPGLDSRLKNIKVSARGWSSLQRDVEVVDGEDLDLGTITLVRVGGTMHGRVTLPDGGAASGVMISGAGPGNEFAFTRTDEDGRYEVVGLKKGESEIWIAHPEKGRLQGKVVIGDEPLERDWVLREAATVTGRVTLGGRVPTPGERGADGRKTRLRVVIQEARRLSLPVRARDVERERPHADVGQDGSFRFLNIPAGDFVVAAEYDGRVAWQSGVHITGTESVEVELDIGVGGVLHGVVLGADGLGEANVPVRLDRTAQSLRSGSRFDRNTTTAEDGTFAFSGLPTGTWFVKLGDETLLAGVELEERRVVVVDGAKSRLEIRLVDDSGPGISGRVLLDGESGFAQVLLVAPGRLMPVSRAAVDDDGNFSMKGVAPGEYYLWFVDSLQYPRLLHRRDLVVETAESRIRIDENLAGASLTGVVDGASDGVVTLRPALEDVFGRDAAARFAVVTVPIREDGSFERPLIVAGDYVVSTVVPDQASHSAEVEISGARHIELGGGGEAGELEVVVKHLVGFPAAGARSDGDPLESLAVMSLIDGEGKDVAEASGDEHALPLVRGLSRTLEGIPAGEYRLILRGRTIETLEVAVTVAAKGENRVLVRLHRAAEVIVALENEDMTAAAMRAVGVVVRDAKGDVVEEIASSISGLDDGLALARRELRVAPLKAGRYTIAITAPGHRTLELDVNVGRSAVVRKKARLERE